MKLPEVLERDYVQSILMIVVVVLAVLAFWYGLRFAYGVENPLLAVASGSMEPVLYRGDLILVEGIQNFSEVHAAPKDAEQPGDIIVYQGTNDLIVHRAVEKTLNNDGTWSFTTWGDNNNHEDPRPVHENQVVARYTGFKVPVLGLIALEFSELWVKVAFVAVWILLLVVVEVVPLIRNRNKNGEEGSKPL